MLLCSASRDRLRLISHRAVALDGGSSVTRRQIDRAGRVYLSVRYFAAGTAAARAAGRDKSGVGVGLDFLLVYLGS